MATAVRVRAVFGCITGIANIRSATSLTGSTPSASLSSGPLFRGPFGASPWLVPAPETHGDAWAIDAHVERMEVTVARVVGIETEQVVVIEVVDQAAHLAIEGLGAHHEPPEASATSRSSWPEKSPVAMEYAVTFDLRSASSRPARAPQ